MQKRSELRNRLHKKPDTEKMGLLPGGGGGGGGGGGDGGGTVGNPNVYNGERVCYTGDGPVFLVDRGVARWIPDVTTFLTVFGDNWGRFEINPGALGDGDQFLPGGTVLIKAYDAAPIYLFDLGKKRLISSPAVMDRYGFRYENVKIIPGYLAAGIPDGDTIAEDWN